MEHISQELMNHPVSGLNLHGSTLRDELPVGKSTLIVFLRHFGCIFCREQVADLRKITASDPNYPPVLFVYQGTVEQGRDFFAGLWAEARAISDSPKTFYDGFGVARGGLKEMFGAEVWSCGARAFLTKGHFIGMKVGDPWTMPTSFLVDGDRVLWTYEGVHAGDHPDFERIPQLAGLRA